MKKQLITLVSLSFAVSLAQAADYTEAQYYTNGMMLGYLHIDANGNIIKPDSAIPFTPIDGKNSGYESKYERDLKIPGKDSDMYVQIPLNGSAGSSGVMEVNKTSGAIVQTSECTGDFTPKNQTGIYCMTMTPDTCSTFLRKFGSKDMTNPIFKNMRGINKTTSSEKVTALQEKMRECSDAMTMIANMNGLSDYNFDPSHRTALQAAAKQSFPIHSVNEENPDLFSGINKLRQKMRIFDVCKSLLQADQSQSGRKEFLRPGSTVK